MQPTPAAELQIEQNDSVIIMSTVAPPETDVGISRPSDVDVGPAAATGPEPNVSLFSDPTEIPSCRFAFKQRSLKGEDMAVAATQLQFPGKPGLDVSVFGVFDGHNGQETSKYCKKNLLNELLPRLPTATMPPENSTESFEWYMEQLRVALRDTFLALNRKSIEASCHSGCTATVMLVTGWVVTIANVGDSFAYVDTPQGLQCLTVSHRLDENAEEVKRLESNGCTVARLNQFLKGPAKPGEQGYGPLRAWPGAVMMSRAIGDGDAGVAVLPYPHITQVKVPPEGARFILASDGVWDSKLKLKGVLKRLRKSMLEKCATKIIQDVLTSTGLVDDTTALVADVLPRGVEDYSHVQCQARTPQRKKSLLPACLSGSSSPVEEDESDVSIHTYSVINTVETVPPEELLRIYQDPDSIALTRMYSVKTGSAPALSQVESLEGLAVFSSSNFPVAARESKELVAEQSLLAAVAEDSGELNTLPAIVETTAKLATATTAHS